MKGWGDALDPECPAKVRSERSHHSVPGFASFAPSRETIGFGIRIEVIMDVGTVVFHAPSAGVIHLTAEEFWADADKLRKPIETVAVAAANVRRVRFKSEFSVGVLQNSILRLACKLNRATRPEP